MKRILFILFAIAAFNAAAQFVHPATGLYPARPVKIIVPIGVGGPSDVVARILADKLTRSLGQTFLVENQPGAGANIGMGNAARAAADGYTLLVVSSSYVVNPSLYPKVPYDLNKDFVAVSLVAVSPNILVVNPSLPVQSVQELTSYLKAHPGQYAFAHPGVGSTPQLSGELFRLTQGVDLVSAPYSGSAPAIQSAVAGHVAIAFSALTPAVALVKAGKLRALAVTTPKRSPSLPDVPTFAEAGLRDQEADTMTGIVAPTGTPQAVITRLSLEIAKAVADPEVRAKLEGLGFEVIGSTPAEFDARIKTEMPKWAKVIQSAHLKAE
jgi:tripartite-type tricarboxylate transporter receptor subunit TctC